MRLLHRFIMVAAAVAVFVFSWFFRFNDLNGGFAGRRDFVDHGAPLYLYVSAAVQVRRQIFFKLGPSF